MTDLKITSNVVTPASSIDINSRQTVKPAGAGVRPNWNPSQGLDRQAQIEQERQQEYEQYQKRIEDATSIGVRVSRLEIELKTISADIAKILQHLGASNVSSNS